MIRSNKKQTINQYRLEKETHKNIQFKLEKLVNWFSRAVKQNPTIQQPYHTYDTMLRTYHKE